MLRFLLTAFLALVAFAAARAIMAWFFRTILGAYRASTQAQPPHAKTVSEEVLASAGELYRDPVCGTFVPGNPNFARQVGGQTIYFCSADCRERFLVPADR